MKWDKPPLPRDQLLLISRSLDDAVPADHLVRVIELVLGALDWSEFTSQYHERLGQPAIPPQVLAGVILYGHVVGVRSSRRLEEALAVRVDFMWLAQGRQIDHSTLSGFRQRFAARPDTRWKMIDLRPTFLRQWVDPPPKRSPGPAASARRAFGSPRPAGGDRGRDCTVFADRITG